MDTNSSSNLNNTIQNLSSTPTVVLTTAELWTQLILFYFGFGSLSIIGYSLMAVGIVRSKQLRSRFFIILCALLIARIFVSLQMFTNFIYRSLRTLSLVPTKLSRIECYLTHVNANFSFTLEMVMLLVLLLDRMTAIVAFNYYRNLTGRQAFFTCVIVAGITLILKLVPSFIAVNFRDSVLCVNGYSGNGPSFNSYTQNIDLSLAILIFVLYLVLIIYLRLYLKFSKNKNEGDMLALKRQMKLLPMMRRLVLIHCGFSFVSKILLGMANDFSDAIGQRFTAYGGMVLIVDMLVNVPMLLVTNKELRQASFPCIAHVTTSSVAPFVTKAPTGTAINGFQNVSRMASHRHM